MPWMMAYSTECHSDHEIVIASALPKLMPLAAIVLLAIVSRPRASST
jgi:hypothetical protein